MKGISKNFSLGVVSLLCFGFILLLFGDGVLAADKNLSTSLKYAVQHIGRVNMIKDNSNVSASIVPDDSRVKVNADNFVVSKNTSGNKIEGTSTTSSILGGGKNVISSSENSTVVAGRQNTVKAATSIIGGGIGNLIEVGSDNSVIIGGNNNSISGGISSSIVGGYKNRIEGEYSAVAGINNTVIGDYSVALGSGSKVTANNSFLWSDGSSSSMLKTDEVFAIMSQNGMIVNGSESVPGVQLTISGSLIVGQSENDTNIQCGGDLGAGSIKLVDKPGTSTQKCLCVCDGSGWNSLLGNGQCQTVCDGSNGTNRVNPECGTGLSLVKGDDGKSSFLGTCLQGEPVEGSYYMINGTNSTGRIYWACQGTNGVTQTCSYKVNCLGDIPSHAHRNNPIVPNIDKEYRYQHNDDNRVVCSFSCDDGYLWTGGICKQICNYASESCDIGTKTYPLTSWTNDYYYDCNYVYNGNNTHYSCNMNCGTNQIRAGATSGCVNKDLACNESTPKYTCNLGILDNESRGMTVEDFVWNCVNSRGGVIKYCSTPKPVIEKDVYYNTSKFGLDETAWFSVSGSIATGIKVVLPYEVNGGNTSAQFVIQANQESSTRETYSSTNGTVTLKWPYLVNDKLPVGEVLYKLKIVNGEINLCAGSCSVAGQCLYGATTSNFNSALNGNTASFTWSCSNGTKTDSCSATCNVNTSSCTSKPSNASDCNPVSDSNCIPLAGGTVNLNDFYMYNASEIISTSSCGKKRHCFKTGSYIDYEITDNYCTQNGFKCNDGYVLEGCSCNNICNTSTNPGTCRGGFNLEYGDATWKTGYTYTCGGITCNATCPGNKVWNGSSCIDKPNVCGGTHYTCTGGSTRTDYNEDTANHIYLWKCRLGSETTQCRECYDGYTLEGTACVAETLNCTGGVYDGYVVPDLEHLGTANVEKDSNSTHCTATSTCNNGDITISGEDCSGVCKTSTNPGTCNIGSPSGYTGTQWGYNYKYSCGGGYADCTVTCPGGKIWNGNNTCVNITSICDNTATNPSTAGCSIGYYSQVSSGADGWVWNCLDANNNKLNGTNLCHKCKSGYSWNSSKKKCMNSVEIKVSCKRTESDSATYYDVGPGFEVDHKIEFEFDKNAPKDIELYVSYEVERSGGSDSDGTTIIISSGSKKGSGVITSHDDNCGHNSYYWLNTDFSRSVPLPVTIGNTVYTFKKGTTDTCGGEVSYNGVYDDYCEIIDLIGNEDTCTSPYFATLNDCNGNKPDGEYKCISSGDSACPYKYVKKSSCSSPCGGGNVESGKSKTCYNASYITCPDTCVANSQTRTCNDGSWDDDFGTSFTKGGCDLNEKVCSTSTYNLSSCPSHGNCSSCVKYTVNGAACNKGATVYKLDSCEAGYDKDGDECKKNFCKLSTNPGGCDYGTAGSYDGATWLTSYSYKCTYNSEVQTCNASCTNGTIWNGSKCLTVNPICNNSASSPSAAGCNAGTYSLVSSSNGYVWNCKDASNNNLNSSVCYKCNNGYHLDGNSCSANSITCNAGYYLKKGDLSCTQCPAGSACPGGSYNYNPSSDQGITQCSCGTYSSVGASSCTNCGATKYSSAGASSCSTASTGYYANSSCSQTACTNKPANSHYTGNASSNSCGWKCDSFYLPEGNTCKEPIRWKWDFFSYCGVDVDPSDNYSYCDKYGDCSYNKTSREDTRTSSSHKKSQRPVFYAVFLSDSEIGYPNKVTDRFDVDGRFPPNRDFYSETSSALPSHSFTTSEVGDYGTKVTVYLSNFTSKAYSRCTTNECLLYHSCNPSSILNNHSIKYYTRVGQRERIESVFGSWPCTYYGMAAYWGGTKKLYQGMIWAEDQYMSSNGMRGKLYAHTYGNSNDNYICAVSVPVYYNKSGQSGGSSGGGGGGCFLSGTQIMTQNGEKNIENLQKGDMVLSYDINSGEQSYNKVVNIIHREVVDEELYELNIENHILKVTGTHRFYIVDADNGYQCSSVWKRAKDIKEGDILLKQDGSYITVDGVNHYAYSGMVYNFEVENTHAYYVDEGYLVHNIQVVEQMIIK